MKCVTILGEEPHSVEQLTDNLLASSIALNNTKVSFYGTTTDNNEYEQKGIIDDDITILILPITNLDYWIQKLVENESIPIIYYGEGTIDYSTKLSNDSLYVDNKQELINLVFETLDSIIDLDAKNVQSQPYLDLLHAINRTTITEIYKEQEYADFNFILSLARLIDKVMFKFDEDFSKKDKIKLNRLRNILLDYDSIVDKSDLIQSMYKEAVNNAFSEVFEIFLKVYK